MAATGDGSQTAHNHVPRHRTAALRWRHALISDIGRKNIGKLDRRRRIGAGIGHRHRVSQQVAHRHGIGRARRLHQQVVAIKGHEGRTVAVMAIAIVRAKNHIIKSSQHADIAIPDAVDKAARHRWRDGNGQIRADGITQVRQENHRVATIEYRGEGVGRRVIVAADQRSVRKRAGTIIAIVVSPARRVETNPISHPGGKIQWNRQRGFRPDPGRAAHVLAQQQRAIVTPDGNLGSRVMPDMSYHQVGVGRKGKRQGIGAAAARRARRIAENPVGNRPAAPRAYQINRPGKVAHHVSKRILGGQAYGERLVHILRRRDGRPLEAGYQTGNAVVIDDGAYPLRVRQQGIGGVEKVDRKRFVAFDDGITRHGNGKGLVGGTRRKRQRAVRGNIIAARDGRQVAGRIAHHNRLGAGIGQSYGENRIGGADIAFEHRDIIYGQERLQHGGRHGGRVVGQKTVYLATVHGHTIGNDPGKGRGSDDGDGRTRRTGKRA